MKSLANKICGNLLDSYSKYIHSMWGLWNTLRVFYIDVGAHLNGYNKK